MVLGLAQRGVTILKMKSEQSDAKGGDKSGFSLSVQALRLALLVEGSAAFATIGLPPLGEFRSAPSAFLVVWFTRVNAVVMILLKPLHLDLRAVDSRVVPNASFFLVVLLGGLFWFAVMWLLLWIWRKATRRRLKSGTGSLD